MEYVAIDSSNRSPHFDIVYVQKVMVVKPGGETILIELGICLGIYAAFVSGITKYVWYDPFHMRETNMVELWNLEYAQVANGLASSF